MHKSKKMGSRLSGWGGREVCEDWLVFIMYAHKLPNKNLIKIIFSKSSSFAFLCNLQNYIYGFGESCWDFDWNCFEPMNPQENCRAHCSESSNNASSVQSPEIGFISFL